MQTAPRVQLTCNGTKSKGESLCRSDAEGPHAEENQAIFVAF